MARDRQTIGPCTHCSQGNLSCTYNLFSKDSLTIHSWEHRCAECGHRVTQAFRSDQIEADPISDPTVCPFCRRKSGVRPSTKTEPKPNGTWSSSRYV